MYQWYRTLREAGLYALPCGVNKQPAVSSWGGKSITESHLKPFGEGLFYNIHHICIVCGEVSGGVTEPVVPKRGDEIGVECIDFDIKHGETYPQWKSLVVDTMGQEFFDRLYIEKSPSQGHHVIYRAKRWMKNTKLAILTPEGKEAAIETRGEGGYVVVAPSTGYEVVHGSLTNLPILTEEERDALISAAKSFNKKVKIEKPPVVTTKASKERKESNGAWEDFNERFDFLGYLYGLGWKVHSTRGRTTYLTRPGKDSSLGMSASFNYHPNQFCMFTSSTDFEEEKSYLPSTAYAILSHGGDKKAAYKAIRDWGYGKPDFTYEKHETTPEGIHTTISVGVPDKIKHQIETAAYEAIKRGDAYSEMLIAEAVAMSGQPAELIREIYKKAYEVYKDFFNFNKFTYQKKAKTLIKSKFRLRVNIITNILEVYSGEKWIDVVPSDIWNIVGDITEANYDTVKRLCYISEVSERYDPFKDYFSSRTWNGEDEITKWCSYIKVENQKFHDMLAKKMFVRCVACALGEFPNRHIWVYKSRQNTGKSWLIRGLAPKALAAYYTEESPTNDKDGIIRLMENMIYNWEELQDSGVKDIKNMKAMLSKMEVKQRRPYGDREERGIRRASFFGSMNDDKFLTDDENTRWIIHNLIEINFKWKTEVDIDNLWAQAYQLYKSGFDFEPNKDEMEEQKEINRTYEVNTPDEELLVKYFGKGEKGREDSIGLTATELLIELTKYSDRTVKLSAAYLGRALKKLGYPSHPTSTGAKEYWVIRYVAQGEVPTGTYEQKVNGHKSAEKKSKTVEADDTLPF